MYYQWYEDKWRDNKGNAKHPMLNYDTTNNTNLQNSIKQGSFTWNTSETCLIEDKQLNENKVHTEQLANDIKKYGRLRGNMEYLEDLWKVEIRPINFKYAYVDDSGTLQLTHRIYETRHRDKFLRVKIRYDGKDLAVIQGINTMFDYSLS